MRTAWALVLVFSLSGACTPSSTDRSPTEASRRDHDAPIAGSWGDLRRPVRLPTLERGAACPKTAGTPSAQLTPDLCCIALGVGPIRPILAGPIVYHPGASRGPHSIVHYVNQPKTKWHAIKTLWMAPIDYKDNVLVRGDQIDGPHQVRFGPWKPRRTELHLRMPGGPLSGGWQHWTSAIRLWAPGCYALQMDAPGFTHRIIFEAGGPYKEPQRRRT
jgi:hypothetical protein